MILVKFGGSVTTNKETFEEKKGKRIFYRERTERLIGEVKTTGEDFVLVHGAGSFGHPLAKRHELKEGYKNKKQIPIVAKVQRDVRYLNLKMMEALGDRGLPSISLPPGVLVTFRNGKLRELKTDPFKHYLKMGTIPVTFGDVVPDVSRSFGICSGDDLMLQLAK